MMQQQPPKKTTLEEVVRENLTRYYDDAGPINATNVYDMVLAAVEKPMLEVTMSVFDGNQSKAALALGINRNTLRMKLKQHNLL